MKNRSVLLLSAAVVGCLLTPRPAAAYIDFLPPTLGDLCRQATHVSVVKVDKVDAERGVILFKPVEQLKGKDATPLPDATFGKQVIGPNVTGAKVILDGAAEGKTAVVFAREGGFKSVAHVYIDGYWYLIIWNRDGNHWTAWNGEPTMLIRYCGTADKLADAVKRILKGEEVVVPAMASDDRKALAERRGKVLEVRASLKILGDFKKNIDAELLAAFADDKKPDGNKPAPPDKPGTKPGDPKPDGNKPGDPKSSLVGVVKALSADGTTLTLKLLPTEKNKEPGTIEIQLTKRTKVVANEGAKLAVGQTVSVWLDKGDEKVAVALEIGKSVEKPGVKPVKPAPDEKPETPRKPRPPAGPVRDTAPTATVIDTEVDKHLAKLKATAADRADDAEFLRRVTLDLTGRVPTYQQTVAFLDSKEADKRRKLIDELLDSSAYGDHFATVWKNLLVGRDGGLGAKQQPGDPFRVWLADQFYDNRAWNALVTDLLTAEGAPNANPATAFLLANGEQGQPQPNKVTGSVAALFLGVNLRCAECHDHPFIHWKQTDFWGTAAFFGKLQYGGAKMGPQTLTESATGPTTKVKGQPSFVVTGSAITIPAVSGKAAGRVVKARFLVGAEPALDEKEPFRPRFAAWMTAPDNPYFAKAAVNRMWAHFFGSGLVNPLDGFDETNPGSHPELLDTLAKEFAASGFDLKHLARCITTSKAYQRSSRPAAGAKADPGAFGHAAVKVLTPEVFFDSVAVVMKGSTEKQEARDQFLRGFRFDEDAPATEYVQGIPQLLRLMNGPFLNRSAPVVDRLVSAKATHAEAVTALYLTVLSRRPSADEVKLMESYLSKRKDDREGYRGVLWILLNTSEFALNH